MDIDKLLDLKVLESLRDQGDPHLIFLRALLELTSQQNQQQRHVHYEQLVFHCGTGFRHIALCRWDSFTVEFRSVSRDFLLSLGLGFRVKSGYNTINNTTTITGGIFPRTLLMTSLHAAATFWKKCWCDYYDSTKSLLDINSSSAVASTTNHNDEIEQSLIHLMRCHTLVPLHSFTSTSQLFDTLETLLRESSKTPVGTDATTDSSVVYPNSMFVASQATTFLINLVTEFSGSSSLLRGTQPATYYHSSLEAHRFAHDTFESHDVGRVLHIAMNTLGTFVSTFSSTTTGTASWTRPFTLPLMGQLTSLCCEVLSWDFGSVDGGKWGSIHLSSSDYYNTPTTSLIRPPEEWRDYLIRPDFLSSLFYLYSSLRSSFSQSMPCRNLGHDIRQLILLLSSLTGIIFVDTHQKFAYSQFLVDGLLHLFSKLVQDCQPTHGSSSLPRILQSLEGEIVDMASIVLKLVANLKIQGLSKLPSFEHVLHAIVALSSILLTADVEECKQCQGDIESMQGLAWRSEALGSFLEACSLLSEDFWLQGNVGTVSSITTIDSPTHHHHQQQPQRTEEATRVHTQLSSILSPLYQTYITSRIDVAKMEEYYVTIQAAELDEDREDIYAQILDEEMKMVATALGRLNVSSSCHFLYSCIQECFPRVMQIFLPISSSTSSTMSPDAAVLLEEARLLILCAGHLLTDECEGETPLIPTAIASACDMNQESSLDTSKRVMNITFAMKALMESQISSLVTDPNNIHLSPLIAKTLLWYFNRWIPGYISLENSKHCCLLSTDTSRDIIDFLATYCWHVMCYWPLEKCVQENVTILLLSMAKCGSVVRNFLTASQSFLLLIILHGASASLSHHCTEQDLTQAIVSISGMTSSIASIAPSFASLVEGYHRVAYVYRARLVTFIVTTLGNSENEFSQTTLQQVYNSIQRSFVHIIESVHRHAVSADHYQTRELVHLLIELFNGVAKVNDSTSGETSVSFLTQHLNSLASLMPWYAQDPVICEALLRFFRDYAENFIFSLNQEQSLVLFRSTSILLKSYSTQTVTTRSTHKAIKISSNGASLDEAEEEEQKYQDVLYAIQLLIHIGSKDFVDTCGSSEHGDVIDFVFYGLQQIIPLMTQGLLQYPNLALQYFSLVGFIMDVYAEKLCTLPYDLFQSLVESLLFGMCHIDYRIAKSSLGGLGGLARELIRNELFRSQLNGQRSDLIESWSYRLLHDVIFQPLIWDRLEAAGMAMLPLVVMDLERFAKAVQSLCGQMDSVSKQDRLRQAFEKLLHLDILSKFSTRGVDGRMNRLRFKKDFDVFVRDIHSFLIVK